MATVTAPLAPPHHGTADRPAADVEPCPTMPALDDPEQEAFGLLGQAWRSSTATALPTGRAFDVVQAPAHHAAPVLLQLKRLGLPQGAVFADGNVWHFFVPLGSGYVPPRLGGPGWPPPANYLSGEWITIPPRRARTADLPLRWVTRSPAGRLLTAPIWLFVALSAQRQQSAPHSKRAAPDEDALAPPSHDRCAPTAVPGQMRGWQ